VVHFLEKAVLRGGLLLDVIPVRFMQSIAGIVTFAKSIRVPDYSTYCEQNEQKGSAKQVLIPVEDKTLPFRYARKKSKKARMSMSWLTVPE